MSKNTRDQDSKTAQLAAPFRMLLRSLLRERIKSEEDKRALAHFLDRSVSFVNQMVYHGEGSLDGWISAFVFAYKLDVETLAGFFADKGHGARKLNPLSAADSLWFSFDETLSEDEKFYWVSLMRVAIELEQDLGIERKVPKRRRTKLTAAEKPLGPKK